MATTHPLNMILATFALALPLAHHAQSIEYVSDPWEVKVQDRWMAPDRLAQRNFRESQAWQASLPHAAGWQVIAQEETQLPSRMWGAGVSIEGEGRAVEAWSWALGAFGWSPGLIGDVTWVEGNKHDRAFSSQALNGLPVLGSMFQAKFRGDRLVLVSSDWWPDLVTVDANHTTAEMQALLEADMAVGEASGNQGTTYLTDFGAEDLGMAWLPVKTEVEGQVIWEAHPTWQVEVTGRRGALPVRYLTWVDMVTGAVVMRSNQVVHEAPAVRTMGGVMPPAASGTVKALAHEAYPYEPESSLGMPHLQLNVNGAVGYTDEAGAFTLDIPGNVIGQTMELTGRYATVFTDGNTPASTFDLAVGSDNSLSAPGNAKEASAYRSVNLIHDHMREWLPEFTDLDFSMPVNIDVAGECNAFYDGASVNFYDLAAGCNPTSLIADVVYHEYGHAINDWYYNSLGSFFLNGAMNEGYADLWAMSLADIAEIGKGFYVDNNDGIRRYDEDPKVFPEDIVGEVHADGEIICGAWYDTHLLMGGDWDQTLTLFVDAYPGLQATVPNGQEGQAYTDVLLDVLQADDDDDDLSNGTPNAAFILEGFDMHGITLFSYIDLAHDAVEFSAEEEDIVIEAEAALTFPYVTYFDAARLHYRSSPNDAYTVVEMAQDGDVFSYAIPGLPQGSVVEYFMDVTDTFGQTSAVTPVASERQVNGNLPNYVLVGVEPVLINDLDVYSDFGYWDIGLLEDNATTGQWEEGTPIGSYSEFGDPSSVVAPTQDHSNGFFGFAYVTGLNPTPSATTGVGENDVDGGHTTLLSPTIDLTPYESPVLAYWRWYANAPATGANPASDWWQVEISNDGGTSWQYLENTSQQDISWRRKAFRIADVIEPTNEFMIRFIASDSTTVGEYLDGGSLVEAAVDDIVLYDAADAVEPGDPTDNIAEAVHSRIQAIPNPASAVVLLKGWMVTSTVQILDLQGREVHQARTDGLGQISVDVSDWPVATYIVKGWSQEGRSTEVKLEVLR